MRFRVDSVEFTSVYSSFFWRRNTAAPPAPGRYPCTCAVPRRYTSGIHIHIHPGVELRGNIKSSLPQVPPLRNGICMGVDLRNHLFAPGLSSGWIGVCDGPWGARARHRLRARTTGCEPLGGERDNRVVIDRGVAAPERELDHPHLLHPLPVQHLPSIRKMLV